MDSQSREEKNKGGGEKRAVTYILHAALCILTLAFMVGLVFGLVGLGELFQSLTAAAIGAISNAGAQIASFALFVESQMEVVTSMVATSMTQILNDMESGLVRVAQETSDFLNYLADSVSRTLDSVVNILGDVISTVISTIEHFARRVFNILEDIAGFLLQYVVAPVAIVLSALISVLAFIIQFLLDNLIRPLFELLEPVIRDLLPLIKGNVATILSLVNSIWDLLHGNPNSLGDQFKNRAGDWSNMSAVGGFGTPFQLGFNAISGGCSVM